MARAGFQIIDASWGRRWTSSAKHGRPTRGGWRVRCRRRKPCCAMRCVRQSRRGSRQPGKLSAER